MIKSARKIFNEYPGQFWLLMGASFIDMVGGWMLFPFFTLYFTERYDVGMSEIGVLFALYAIGGLFGSVLGGALTDKLGRKRMVLFGLAVSATFSLTVINVNDFELVLVLVAFIGVFGSVSGPARQAMIADLLPEEQHADGYAVFRIVMNVAAAVGPMLGGIISSASFIYLFITDAVTSVITAVILIFALRETMSVAAKAAAESGSMKETFKGYGIVLRDVLFMLFLLVSILVSIVYMQLNFSLPVFMRDARGFEPRQYGYLLSINAVMVVFMQFWITRRMRPFSPMRVMVVGTLLYGIGFGMFGFVTAYSLFILASVILTLGEMVVVPTWQAIIARLAPEAYRGRYMAIGSIAYILPGMVGPLAVGFIMDNYNENMIWYLAGVFCLIAAGGYAILDIRAPKLQESSDATLARPPKAWTQEMAALTMTDLGE